MKNRIILHIDMDAFFTAIEERENPQFKGTPIIVGADPKEGRGRGVVSSASYLARKFGIKSGMPISKAYQLCPRAIFLPVNMELYQKVSENIMEILAKYSKTIEQVSIDEAYLDISFANNYKKAESVAKKIKKEVFEKEKLCSTIGIGPNKLIAKMASNFAKPDGLLFIKPDQVRKFIDPLDIQELAGIGPKTGMRIAQSLSLRSRHYSNGPIRINDLKLLSKSELKELLGKVGEEIYEKARGIDESPIVINKVIKAIGKEHTFENDTRDSEIIFKTFEKIIKDVHQEFVENNFSFRTITVICRFSGFETYTKSKTLKIPTDNFKILEKEAKKLLLRFIIENPKLIRLIGLRAKIC